MKNLIISCLLIVACLSAKSQIKDTIGLNLQFIDNDIAYQGIVEMPNKPKAVIYKNGKIWFVDFFKSAKAVIQSEDKEDGIIAGKGIIDFTTPAGWGMNAKMHDQFTIKIECKDNKFRYTIYQMILSPEAFNENYTYPLNTYYGKLIGTKKLSTTKSLARKAIESNAIAVNNMIASLKEAMMKDSGDF